MASKKKNKSKPGRERRKALKPAFRKKSSLQADIAGEQLVKGNTLFNRNRLEEAIAHYRRALELKPDYIQALNNLGTALNDLGRRDEAVIFYRRALDLQPDLVHVHFNLGITLKDLGRLDEAAESFRQVLASRPAYVEAQYNLGVVLLDQARLDEAADCFRQALDLQPNLAEAYNNLGVILLDQGNLIGAEESCRRALALKPNFTKAHNTLLMVLNYLPELSPSEYLNEARCFGENAASKVSRRFTGWTCSSEPERLRIGVVSGDLRNHPVGYFLENMLTHLNTSRFELIAYPTHFQEDELTVRIRSRFAAWKPLWSMHDNAAANLIHGDGVHILIDLSGHTKHNRLPVFSWKPAPVQVAWLGYFASTGIPEIDYLLADQVSVPESHRDHFTEIIRYLPETRFCFSPPVTYGELPVAPLPALRNGHITFGSFQSLSKINDRVVSAWGRIFSEMPKAILRLQNRQLNSPKMREQMLRRLAQNGIAPERVILEKAVPREQYLAAHAHIDIILDTFPFNGGTTTCESLWMGAPTVTLAGSTMVARQGAALLTCAGLTDWIASGVDDYAAKALAHAADLEKLSQLRAELRNQLLTSPLCDSPRFARNFAAVLLEMWRRFVTTRS